MSNSPADPLLVLSRGSTATARLRRLRLHSTKQHQRAVAMQTVATIAPITCGDILPLCWGEVSSLSLQARLIAPVLLGNETTYDSLGAATSEGCGAADCPFPTKWLVCGCAAVIVFPNDVKSPGITDRMEPPPGVSASAVDPDKPAGGAVPGIKLAGDA